mgnify:CR=1 FL=1
MRMMFRPVFLDGFICELNSVRGGVDGCAVELWRRGGRLIRRAYSEPCYDFTEIDFWDLLQWVQHGHELQDRIPESA